MAVGYRPVADDRREAGSDPLAAFTSPNQANVTAAGKRMAGRKVSATSRHCAPVADEAGGVQPPVLRVLLCHVHCTACVRVCCPAHIPSSSSMHGRAALCDLLVLASVWVCVCGVYVRAAGRRAVCRSWLAGDSFAHSSLHSIRSVQHSTEPPSYHMTRTVLLV